MTASILHICRDDVTGGAARCAHRLHAGLRRIGLKSRMLVQRRRGTDPSVEQYEPMSGPAERIRRSLRRRAIRRDFGRYRGTRPNDAEAFSDDRSPFGGDPARWVRHGDVVHLHWTSGFIDLDRFLSDLPRRTRIVWTLHDMNLFTGGCHYVGDCERFSGECGVCPQLGSQSESDLSRQIWQRRRAALSRLDPSRLRIVAPSRWLAAEAERSGMLRNQYPISVIPYGLDTSDFAPRDRAEARRTLGIPADAVVVLFLAESVGGKRKGFEHLLRALPALSDIPSLFLLSLGKGEGSAPPGIDSRHIGPTGDDRLLSLVYSAADVFTIPSMEDNLPATVLEAMACGTPVAGFAVGGVPDMVRPGENGGLAGPGDSAGLAAVIRELVQDRQALAAAGRRAREIAVSEYGLEVQARRYSALYGTLSAAHSGEAA